MSSPNNNTTAMPTSLSSDLASKYKSSYLIEKLLNESTPPPPPLSNALEATTGAGMMFSHLHHQRYHMTTPRGGTVITAYDSPIIGGTDHHHELNNKSSSPIEADARSEAGTYTIDENVPGDIAVLDDLECKESHQMSPAKLSPTTAAAVGAVRKSSNGGGVIEGGGGAATSVGKSITTPSIVELASARAAIDQTFGVRRLVESESAGEMINMVINMNNSSSSAGMKRSPQKVTRLRNKTYSLRKDVLDGSDDPMMNDQQATQVEVGEGESSVSRGGEVVMMDDHHHHHHHQQGGKPFLLSSSSSSSASSASSHSMMPETNSNQNLSSHQQQQQQASPSSPSSISPSSSSNMKKTTTYEVISAEAQQQQQQQQPQQASSVSPRATVANNESARTNVSSNLGTELLLGDTEKLIEQLKLRRFEKTKQLKTKLLAANSACFQNSLQPQQQLQQPLHLNGTSTTTTNTTTTTSTTANNNANNANNLDGFSTSSASSSSTNLSNTNESKPQRSNSNSRATSTHGQAWIIPTEGGNTSPRPARPPPLVHNDNDDDATGMTMAGASTRATVDFSLNSSRSSSNNIMTSQQQHRGASGGLAFDYFIDTNKPQPATESSNSPTEVTYRSSAMNSDSLAGSGDSADFNSTLTAMTLTKRFEMRKAAAAAAAAARKRTSVGDMGVVDTSSSTSTVTAASSSLVGTPKYSAVSMGAKIAEKARLNQANIPPTTTAGLISSPQSIQLQQHRRGSENGLGLLTPTSLTASTPVQYTNRTLALRQESAKAKRNSLEKAAAAQKTTTSSNGILKKTSPSSGLNKSSSTVLPGRASSSTGGSGGGGKQMGGSKSSSRSNSQTRMSSGHHHHQQLQQSASSHMTNALMTASLNLPSGMHLPLSSSSSSSKNSDPFQRRKMYDPMRAVELEKQLRRQQQQHQQQQGLRTSSSMAKRANSSSDKLYEANLSYVNLETGSGGGGADNVNDDIFGPGGALSIDTSSQHPRESMSTRRSDNPPSIRNSAVVAETTTVKQQQQQQQQSSTATSDNHYEKIMQSTLQRLCIRLIQVSTGVLDKIGDNTSKMCDGIQFTNATSELERMQVLAKLVHSMQLVNDHIQFIDSAVFNNKSEENYIKELSKIRQEVDILKQSAGLNSPSTSSLNTSSSKLT